MKNNNLQTIIQTKPKLAFVGVGWIGRNRLQSAVESNLAEVTRIADPSATCIDEACKITPAALSASSFKDILDDTEIDGVVIASPSALHMQQSIAALESGKAVFCQKPIGRNATEVAEVINAARKFNKLFGADFSYRYTTAFQQIKKVIQSGELGKIFSVDLVFHNAYGPDKPWFYDMKLSGGGCVLDLGIHLVDLLMLALDFPEVLSINSKLFSKGAMLKNKNEVEDFAQAQLLLDDNINVNISCSWNLHAGREAIIEAGFYGTNGGVSFKNINGSFFDFEGLQFNATQTKILTNQPDDWGGKALLNWIKQLSVNNYFNAEAENYLASAKIVDSIYGR